MTSPQKNHHPWEPISRTPIVTPTPTGGRDPASTSLSFHDTWRPSLPVPHNMDYQSRGSLHGIPLGPTDRGCEDYTRGRKRQRLSKDHMGSPEATTANLSTSHRPLLQQSFAVTNAQSIPSNPFSSNNPFSRTQPLPSMRAQRPNVQTSPPPLSPILPSTPNGNEIRRTNHGNAQTLGPLVAKIHNMVQELNGIVDMKFCPNGNIHNGVDNNITNFNETVFIPARRKMTGTEFYSMDSIRSCLEGVHEALGMRVEALRRSLGNNEVMSVASISSTTSTPSTAPQDQAYAANLSTLQHRVSTLSLAHETLQKEHNNLLSAFSRSQTRAGTLEKKISVSTEENENLSNERERLQGNLEVLEEEVVDLRLERDDARKELAATRSQWIGILKGAGKLERKSEQDKAEFRSQLAQANKREAELRERLEEGEKAITRLQEDLELLDCNLTSTGDLNATSTAPGIDAVDPNSPTSAKRDASLSILRLKKRNEKLRVRISQLEDCIKEFRDHNAEISATADKFMKMGWEAVKKANGVLTGCASPIVIEDEDWRPTGRTERH